MASHSCRSFAEGFQIYVRLALAEVDLTRVAIRSHVVVWIAGLHLPNAADGDDDVRIGSVEMLIDGVDVRHFLEQLGF